MAHGKLYLNHNYRELHTIFLAFPAPPIASPTSCSVCTDVEIGSPDLAYPGRLSFPFPMVLNERSRRYVLSYGSVHPQYTARHFLEIGTPWNSVIPTFWQRVSDLWYMVSPVLGIMSHSQFSLTSHCFF